MTDNVTKYWEQFKTDMNEPTAVFGSAWAFGKGSQQADDLARLTLTGIKTATASAYELYQLENEPIPVAKQGYDVLLNGAGEPVAIICTTNVEVRKYADVDERHAYAEGEGDRSLAYWRQVHESFFRAEFAEAGELLDLTRLHVVLEELTVIYSEPLR